MEKEISHSNQRGLNMDDSNISNSGYTEKSNEKDIVFHSEKETSRIPIQIEDEGKTPASPAKHPSDNQESSQTNNIDLNSQTLMNSSSDLSGKELPQKTPIPQARKQSSESEGLLEVTPLGPDNMSHRDDEEIFIQKDDEETVTKVDDEETETEVDDEETETETEVDEEKTETKLNDEDNIVIPEIYKYHRMHRLLKPYEQLVDEDHHYSYTILGHLGISAYNVVYKARKKNLLTGDEKIRALKEYNPRISSDNFEEYSLHMLMFRQEYDTLLSLKHENIVSVSDFFEINNIYYFDMDFIYLFPHKCFTLYDTLHYSHIRSILTDNDILVIIKTIKYLHSKNILLLDFNLKNILVGRKFDNQNSNMDYQINEDGNKEDEIKYINKFPPQIFITNFEKSINLDKINYSIIPTRLTPGYSKENILLPRIEMTATSFLSLTNEERNIFNTSLDIFVLGVIIYKFYLYQSPKYHVDINSLPYSDRTPSINDVYSLDVDIELKRIIVKSLHYDLAAYLSVDELLVDFQNYIKIKKKRIRKETIRSIANNAKDLFSRLLHKKKSNDNHQSENNDIENDHSDFSKYSFYRASVQEASSLLNSDIISRIIVDQWDIRIKEKRIRFYIPQPGPRNDSDDVWETVISDREYVQLVKLISECLSECEISSGGLILIIHHTSNALHDFLADRTISDEEYDERSMWT